MHGGPDPVENVISDSVSLFGLTWASWCKDYVVMVKQSVNRNGTLDLNSVKPLHVVWCHCSAFLKKLLHIFAQAVLLLAILSVESKSCLY
jgi:hypothetical protein